MIPGPHVWNSYDGSKMESMQRLGKLVVAGVSGLWSALRGRIVGVPEWRTYSDGRMYVLPEPSIPFPPMHIHYQRCRLKRRGLV